MAAEKPCGGKGAAKQNLACAKVLSNILVYQFGGLNLARGGLRTLLVLLPTKRNKDNQVYFVRFKSLPEYGHSLPNCTILRGFEHPYDLLARAVFGISVFVICTLGRRRSFCWVEPCEKGGSVHYWFCCQRRQAHTLRNSILFC